MKVLIVNTSDIEGGAARAAFRLHKSLLLEKIDSQMLVMNKASDVKTVHGADSKFNKGLAHLRPVLDYLPVSRYKSKTKTLFTPAWLPFSDIVNRINQIKPDIVHLHWIAGGMLRVEDIARIKVPIVWSLHDMWPFTGGCHYDEGCKAYQQSCGNCKVLRSNKENDLSRKIFLRKKYVFEKNSNLTLIGLSHWLANKAKSSTLFSQFKVLNLPNPIDTQAFAPYSKVSSRTLLNLPLNKKLILFGAMGATDDPRKGFQELSQALQTLSVTDIELVVFGSSAPVQGSIFKQKIHYLGRLHDDAAFRALYSAVDVTLVPSLQENLSNTIMESLACATPVVGFDIGGNSDLIEHKGNGYLAKPYDVSDLAAGIAWVLAYANSQQLSRAAREKVLANFDSQHVAQQYIELYKEILAQ